MRTLVALSTLVIATLACSTAANAQERTEDQCSKLHPEITSPVEMVTCTSDLAGSTKVLNRAYGLAAKTVEGDQLTALEKAQRAWLDFRNAECQLETDGIPGSTGFDSGVILCTADMNRRRAAELQKLAQDFK